MIILSYDVDLIIRKDIKAAYKELIAAVTVYQELDGDDACSYDCREHLGYVLAYVGDLWLREETYNEAALVYEQVVDLYRALPESNDYREAGLNNATRVLEQIRLLSNLEKKNNAQNKHSVLHEQVLAWKKMANIRPEYLSIVYCRLILIYLDACLAATNSVLTPLQKQMLKECYERLYKYCREEPLYDHCNKAHQQIEEENYRRDW